MMFATNLIVAIVIMSSIVSTSSEHIKMESMIFRHDFVKQSRSSPDKIHEVVFSINQNFDLIESELLERSDPNSDKYQQWLTFDEVGELTSNIEGAMELLSWLEANGVTPSWISEHDDYIKASAPISVWETLLNTEFYEWEDQDSDLKTTRTYTRSEHYSLPAELTPHISAVFNTCQAFPKIRKHAQYKSSETRPLDFRTTVDIRRLQANLNKVIEDEEATATTVEFLSEYYNIPVERGDDVQT
jgi:subtilase family serine protease